MQQKCHNLDSNFYIHFKSIQHTAADSLWLQNCSRQQNMSECITASMTSAQL